MGGRRTRPDPGRPGVTLFNDTFTNHYEPEIGAAAVEILERGGCAVNIIAPGMLRTSADLARPAGPGACGCGES